MKFNEMTYTRPDIDALLARCRELAAKAAAAPDGDALVRLYYEQSEAFAEYNTCLLYTSPSPRDGLLSRMPSSA